MHRHATRQVCGKPNYTVLQHGHTVHGLRQTDRHTIYYVNYAVFVYNVIFDKFLSAIGRLLNSSSYR